MHRPQRIYTVRLIDGTFDGTKVLTSELFHFNGVFFNRKDLKEAKQLTEINQQGIYFLLKSNKGKIEKIYVGMTKEGIRRIETHVNDKKKNWFEYCFILTLNSASSVSGNVIENLESEFIEILKKNTSYECDNGKSTHVILNPAERSIAEVYRQEIDFLLEACGININQTSCGFSNVPHEILFRMKRNGLDAHLKYLPDEGKYIVLEGSEIDMRRTADSVTGDAFRRRMELFNGSNSIELLGCDADFFSASAASSFVIGNSSNGKVDWVLESDGKTPLKDFLE